MKLIIAGSRDITNYDALKAAFAWTELKLDGLEIISGCARGVDSLAIEFAEEHNLILHKFPADWKTNGKAAGFIRNQQMADFADSLLALWDGSSRGTQDMINRAKKKGLRVFTYII
jgi:hypothetical protein